MTEKKSILVLFGSETGNCESISKRIHQEALGLGYDSKWHKLNDFKKVRQKKRIIGALISENMTIKI